MSLQSLALLNSDFAVKRAKAAATRLQHGQTDNLSRVKQAFQLFYCREPSDQELTESIRFLDEQSKHYADGPDPQNADAGDRAWQDFCQSIMASSEFLYVE